MGRAKELALLGDIISAETAADYGLIYKLVPANQLDEAVESLIGRLSKGPTTALAFTKSLLNNAFDVTLQQALDNETMAMCVNLATSDAREASRAFVEKRAADFTGR